MSFLLNLLIFYSPICIYLCSTSSSSSFNDPLWLLPWQMVMFSSDLRQPPHQSAGDSSHFTNALMTASCFVFHPASLALLLPRLQRRAGVMDRSPSSGRRSLRLPGGGEGGVCGLVQPVQDPLCAALRRLGRFPRRLGVCSSAELAHVDGVHVHAHVADVADGSPPDDPDEVCAG